MSSDKGTARRMVSELPAEGDEAFEAQEARRFLKFREMLWAQVEGCHERWGEDMEGSRSSDANQESWLFLKLSERYWGGSDA